MLQYAQNFSDLSKVPFAIAFNNAYCPCTTVTPSNGIGGCNILPLFLLANIETNKFEGYPLRYAKKNYDF